MPITPLPAASTINFEDIPPLVNAGFLEIASDIAAAAAAAKVYDQASLVLGKPTAGARVFLLVAVRAFDIPINMTGSRARSVIATTADKIFSIKRNGTEIATFTFTAGTSVATFTCAATINFVEGDYLEVFAPAVQDATLSDVAWNFKIMNT